MRKHPRPFRKLRGLRPLATFCALGALVFLLAFLGETQPAARQVASIPPGGEVRLFEERGGLCLLAYSGQAPGTSALYALDTATGETLSNYVFFQGTLVWARQRGSSLFAVEHSAAGYTLHQVRFAQFWLRTHSIPGFFPAFRRTPSRCSTATGRAGFSMRTAF